MPTKIKIELRCRQNADGSYEAGSYQDSSVLVDPKYGVKNGTCDDIKRIYAELRKAYPDDVAIHVGEACSACLQDYSN